MRRKPHCDGLRVAILAENGHIGARRAVARGRRAGRRRRAVEDVHIHEVYDTYPIYHRRYKRAYNAAHRTVKGFSRGIELVGRSGAYWYNNSDHSIRMALDVADRLLGKHNDFDHRVYFGSGHE